MRRLSCCLIVLGTWSLAALLARAQGVLVAQKETRGGIKTEAIPAWLVR